MLFYLLLGDEDEEMVLYVEKDKHHYLSLKFNSTYQFWIYGENDIMDAIMGYNPYEPAGSPYKIGNIDYMKDIKYITKKEAEKFIGCEIYEKSLYEHFELIGK